MELNFNAPLRSIKTAQFHVKRSAIALFIHTQELDAEGGNVLNKVYYFV